MEIIEAEIGETFDEFLVLIRNATETALAMGLALVVDATIFESL